MKRDLIKVVRLAATQKGQAAQFLARAFRKTHVVISSRRNQRRIAAWQWEAVIDTVCIRRIYTTPDVSGVACWLEPGNTKVSIWRMLRSGMKLRRALMRYGGSALRASMDMMGYLDRIHERLMDAPHWYLWALGVDPASQRHGIGGKLIQPVLILADQMGVACYLETLAKENLAFYQKLGFEITNTGEVPGHELKAWMMVKDPHSGMKSSKRT
jgi:ribosomal protein S18 acetylase RimI-like enzyme